MQRSMVMRVRSCGGRVALVLRRRRRRRRPGGDSRGAGGSQARRSRARADGHPDLQGIYDLATLTPVERPAGTPLVLTDEEAAKLEQQAARRARSARRAPIDGDRAAPPDRRRRLDRRRPATSAATTTSGSTPASRYTVDRRPEAHVDRHRSAGRPRAADDAGGAAAACRAQRRGRPRISRRARTIRASRAAGAYDDPERRPLGERCLLGFGSTSGPPVLPNYFYNNLHQIVQTKDT